MQHITRNRQLTPEEITRYNKIREQVQKEFPPMKNQFRDNVPGIPTVFVGCFAFLLWLCIIVGIIWTAIHFIVKYW